MPNPHRRFRPSFDALENRLTPANFAGSVTAGSLVIHGDNGDSSLILTQTSPTTFVLQATDGTTTINGSASTMTFTGVTRTVHIGLGNGSDSLQIGTGKGDQFVVRRDLIIEGVGGNKTVTINADLQVGGRLDINTTTGNDTISIFGALRVAGTVHITGGLGDNAVTIAPSSGATNTVKGNLVVMNNFGNSTTEVFDTNVGKDLNLSDAGNINGESHITFGVSSASVKTSVGGSATLRASQGTGSIRLADTDVRGGAFLWAGEYGPLNDKFGPFSIDVGPFVVASPNTIRGDLQIHSTGAALVNLGMSEEGTFGLSVLRNAIVWTGSADDTINMAGLTVAKDLRLNTTAGADLVAIDDSSFRGLVSLQTGDGADTLMLDGREDVRFTGSTDFLKAANFNLGAGDDLLVAGVLGDASRSLHLRSTAKFDGGPGFDTLGFAANLVNLGTARNGSNAFVNFEQ